MYYISHCYNLLIILHCYLLIQAINVIECPEFQRLHLLLCSDLKDSDIPHCMKTRELILAKAWRDYFVVLKADLKVSSRSGSESDWLNDGLHSKLLVKFHLHQTSGLQITSIHVLPWQHIGLDGTKKQVDLPWRPRWLDSTISLPGTQVKSLQWPCSTSLITSKFPWDA